MRDVQVIVIPKDRTKKPKNMLWEDCKSWLGIDNDKMKELIDSGEEINGYFIDEALIYDSKLS